jgi:hypothetical protein
MRRWLTLAILAIGFSGCRSMPELAREKPDQIKPSSLPSGEATSFGGT